MSDDWVEVRQGPSESPTEERCFSLTSGETQKEKEEEFHSVIYQICRLKGETFVGEGGVAFVNKAIKPPGGDTLWNSLYDTANRHAGCRCCTRAAYTCAPLIGPRGPLFLRGIETTDPHISSLQTITKMMCMSCAESFEWVLVTPDTFPPVKFTHPRGSNQGDFSHWTVVPTDVTPPEALQRIQGLWDNLTRGKVFDIRLSEFLTEDARKDMKMISDLLVLTDRPDHYKNAVDWVLGIQAKFDYTDFQALSEVDKMYVRIFAAMTGNARGSVHFDFSTSGAFKGFMESSSREEVIRKMNSQSHPDNHMQTALSRALAKHSRASASKFTVSLVWDGVKNKDDLDLHVWIVIHGRRQGHVYYGRKTYKGYTLDFDAGISGTEADPVENISCDIGTIEIQVDCYTRRTWDNIPFTVFIREYGEIVKEIPGIYPKDRSSQNPMDICTHDFVDSQDTVPKMSAKAASAAAAQDADFNAKIGVPSCTIATMKDILDDSMEVIQCRTQSTGGASMAEPTCDASSVDSMFSQMMQASMTPVSKSKPRLHRACETEPSTVQDLIRIMKSGDHDLSIHVPDHVPGYLTKVTAKTPLKSGKTSMTSMCHYKDKFCPPDKTIISGTARLDSNWVPTRADGKVSVTSIALLGEKIFFFLKNARLPDVPEYPLGGGFYPQDLSVSQHVHRGRWTFFHTQLKPKLPMDATDSNPLAIGTFLCGDTSTVYLDGRKFVLSM